MIQVTVYCTGDNHIFLFQTEDISMEKRPCGSPPVGMWSEAWVCGLLFAGIELLNAVEGMDVTC